jgi:hypothetical protein
MIDSLINLLFRCSHHRLTRPLSAVTKAGVPHGGTYVVCLDCGKQFTYDVKEMKMGKAIEHSDDACVLPANMPKPRPSKVHVGLVAAALPVGFLLGSALKKGSAKSAPVPKPTVPKPEPPKPSDEPAKPDKE